jgi:protease I
MQTKVLIMASSGFEQDELFVPLEQLRAAGCQVALAAPSLEPIRATVLDDPGEWITPDMPIAQADVEEWDALLLPGGLINPDHLRTNREAVALVRAFLDSDKAVGAICHGPWLLIEADGVRGRRVTGWPSIRTDLRNAGGLVSEGPVVRDRHLVTAVGPADSLDFAHALLAAAQLRKKQPLHG